MSKLVKKRPPLDRRRFSPVFPFRSSPPKTIAAKKPLVLEGTGHQSQDSQVYAKGTPGGLEMRTIMQILTLPEKGHVFDLIVGLSQSELLNSGIRPAHVWKSKQNFELLAWRAI